MYLHSIIRNTQITDIDKDGPGWFLKDLHVTGVFQDRPFSGSINPVGSASGSVSVDLDDGSSMTRCVPLWTITDVEGAAGPITTQQLHALIHFDKALGLLAKRAQS